MVLVIRMLKRGEIFKVSPFHNIISLIHLPAITSY